MNVSRVLAGIRAQVDPENLIDSCSGEGCRVDMTDIPSRRVVIDVESEFKSRKIATKRCDPLLFYVNPNENNLVAAPIERKSGKAYESDVIGKLENSLDFAASIAPGSKTLKTVYVPILFHTRGINWTNPRGRKQLNVRFHGRNLRILTGRCNTPKNLAKVLSDSGYL